MKIIAIKDKVSCIGGMVLNTLMHGSSYIKEIEFDAVISKDFIFYLGEKGRMDYYESFTKPLFKIDVPGKFLIKGLEGEKTLHIYLSRKDVKGSEELFQQIICEYNG
ncbi:MAG: hypothetical protein HQK89_02780 [Nitrospirae bacterium]|nr:hypothetical protein [Nitrospirota bacterium]